MTALPASTKASLTNYVKMATLSMKVSTHKG
jgi:hypothetical protein